MPYPEMLIAPMRGEMTAIGARELSQAARSGIAREGDHGVVAEAAHVHGPAVGCDGHPGRAPEGPPGVVASGYVSGRRVDDASVGAGKLFLDPVEPLQQRPDHLATVFAGADVEATDRARSYFTGFAPSSPSIGILRDGKLIYMLERRDIETRSAEMIAAELIRAFDAVCSAPIA